MNKLAFLFIKYTKFRGSAYQINCIQSKRLIEVISDSVTLLGGCNNGQPSPLISA